MSSPTRRTRTVSYGVKGTRCTPLDRPLGRRNSFRYVRPSSPPTQTAAYPTQRTAARRTRATDTVPDTRASPTRTPRKHRRPRGVHERTAERESTAHMWRRLFRTDRSDTRSLNPIHTSSRQRTADWVKAGRRRDKETAREEDSFLPPSRPPNVTAQPECPPTVSAQQAPEYDYDERPFGPTGVPEKTDDENRSNDSSETIKVPKAAPTPPRATFDDASEGVEMRSSLITLPVSVTVLNPDIKTPSIIIRADTGLTVRLDIVRASGKILYSTYNDGSTLTVDRRESSCVLRMCRSDGFDPNSTLKVPVLFDIEDRDKGLLDEPLDGLE